jgi:hypothetical protein
MVTDGSASTTTFAMTELNGAWSLARKLNHIPRGQQREPSQAVRCASEGCARIFRLRRHLKPRGQRDACSLIPILSHSPLAPSERVATHVMVVCENTRDGRISLCVYRSGDCLTPLFSLSYMSNLILQCGYARCSLLNNVITSHRLTHQCRPLDFLLASRIWDRGGGQGNQIAFARSEGMPQPLTQQRSWRLANGHCA